MDEYLTIAEVAARLKLSAKSVRNKISAGVFREGAHFFRPAGLGTRFKWSAVVAWLSRNQPRILKTIRFRWLAATIWEYRKK